MFPHHRDVAHVSRVAECNVSTRGPACRRIRPKTISVAYHRNFVRNFGGRLGKINALFKPRADTGQPVMSAASRVPHASTRALGARRREASLACQLLNRMLELGRPQSYRNLAIMRSHKPCIMNNFHEVASRNPHPCSLIFKFGKASIDLRANRHGHPMDT